LIELHPPPLARVTGYQIGKHQVSRSLQCGILAWLKTGMGQMLLLPHRITDDRFTPISGLYLKLIDWPKGARSGCEHMQQHAADAGLTRSPRRRGRAALSGQVKQCS
jgi:hypothetical protein